MRDRIFGGAAYRGIVALFSTLVLVLVSTGVRANPEEVGEWAPIIEGFPVPAVHSLLLHTNKLLFFRGDGEDEGGVGDYRTHILNLDNFEFETTFQMDANVFCSGHSYLPDGRILLSGGEKEENLGPRYVHTFDPITETWTREPDMRNGRYYPTNTALGDGTTLFFGGLDPNGDDNADVERFIPAGGPNGENIIDYLEGSDRAMTWYPRMHLLPDGKVFRAGQEQDAYTFDPDTHDWEYVDDSNHGERYWGTSVALPPSQEKIMIFGGVNRAVTDLSTSTAEIIDLTDPSPTWRYTNPMHQPRMHVNVLLLPDGKIFVAGGMKDMDHTMPVYDSEMFDPVTEEWTLLPPQESARSYHSTSILLPDARVMWLGAYTDTGGNSDNTGQIYSPAYLFQGYRPTLTSSPDEADYGDTITVGTPDAATISSVVAIRPSATTHSVNMEQRYVPLSFTQTDDNTLQVSIPTNPNDAPPGYYMLFLVDTNGVPAIAPFIRLGGALPPNVDAGSKQDTILPATVSLDGTVTDFGDPADTTITWSVVSGTGPVDFTDPNAEDTVATFYAPGTYVLRLTADAVGFSVVSDAVTIDVYPEGRVEVPVDASNDDAEEAAAGNMKLTSLDLEMLDYDSGGPHRAIGLRFNNVDVAGGTQIANAYIQFTAQSSDAGASTFSIAGEAIDDAPAFNSSTGDITSRTPTAATVTWMPAEWSAGSSGAAEATTNIAAIIEEIVSRPGWVSGNSIVLMITGAGSRVADTFDANPASAATLQIDPAGNQACQDGVDNDVDGAVDYPDDPGCSSANDPSEREASRVCDDGLDNDGDGFIDYPLDTGCVSLIDGSESEFEALCIDGLDNDGDGLFDYPNDPGCSDGDDNDERGPAYVCDDGIDNDGDLLADYPADPGCAGAADTSEVDGLVVADYGLVDDDEDAEEKQDGSITLTSSDLEMLDYDVGSPHRAAGVRFAGLPIPHGAIVSSAYIQFTAASSSSGVANFVVHAEDADSAAPFTTTAFDLSNRPATAVTAAWSPGPWSNGAAGTDERTSDLAGVIQAVVDRDGWASGNAIAFIITGSGDRVADTRDVAPDDAATLHIEYATEPVGNSMPTIGITMPVDGVGIDEGDALTLVATANDDEDGNISANIAWSSNLQGTLGNGASISATLTEGTHTVTAAITDSGGLSASDQISVQVAMAPNTAPTVTISAPADGLSVVEGTALTFTGSASDDEDGDISLGLQWNSNLDGNFATGGTASAGLSVGVHTITASVSDTGGLPGSQQITVTVIANVAPGVSITGPADGSSVVEGTSINFLASATDGEDGDLGTSLNWNSNIDGDFATGSNVNATLSVGVHTITASVTDSGGLPGSQQITVTVTANVAPGVSITGPADGTSVVDGASVTLIATAADDEDGDLSLGLNWSSNLDGDLGAGGTVNTTLSIGVHTITAAVTDIAAAPNTAPVVSISAPLSGTAVLAGTPLTFIATATDGEDGSLAPALIWNSSIDGNFASGGTGSTTLSVGVHTITAAVTDSGGLPGSAQITVTVNTLPPPNTAPDVSVTAPADGTSVVEGTELTFVGTATDSQDGDLALGLNWNSNIDGDFATGGTVNATLSIGVHTIIASVTDAGGLPGSQQITVTVTASTNTPPGVAITDPADGTSVVEGALLSFAGTANDAEDGDIGAALVWESTIDGSLGAGASTSATLSLGVHTITATSTDSGGLPGSAQITVTITEVPRVVSIDVLPGDSANVVLPNKAGNLPVAVLSSADFDASTVDPDSLRFGLGEATRTGDVEISDVDGQFGNDTTVRFPVQDSGIFCNDTEVSMYGETLAGSPITGTGSIDATQCETGQCHAY